MSSIKIKLNQTQAHAIANAPVTGAYGSAERIRLKEDIGKAISEKKDDPTDLVLEASKEELKAWAAGCIDGWGQATVSTQVGLIPMADGHRNLLRLSAKALRVWGSVSKALPKVEVEESFEIDPDMDDEIALDEIP